MRVDECAKCGHDQLRRDPGYFGDVYRCRDCGHLHMDARTPESRVTIYWDEDA